MRYAPIDGASKPTWGIVVYGLINVVPQAGLTGAYDGLVLLG